MAEVELKKLKRSEILELMIRQADEVRALRRAMEEHEAQYQEQLDAKNDTIARLRAGLGIAEEDSAESRQMDQVYKQIEQKMRRYRARIKELEKEVDALKQMIQDGEWE